MKNYAEERNTMKFYIASLLCIAALSVNGVAETEEQCVDKIPRSCYRWAHWGECTKPGKDGASTRSYCCKSCTYRTGNDGTVDCPEDYTILTDEAECTKAAKVLKQKTRPKGCFKFGAVGCVYSRNGIFFNTCGERSETSKKHKAICVIDWKYKTGEYETVNCPKGYSLLTDRAECENQAAKLLKKTVRAQGCFRSGAVGCVYKENGIFFNTCGKRPETSPRHKAVCVKDKEEAVKGDVPTDLSDEEVIQEVMRKSKVHQVADDIALEEDYM